MAPMVHGGRLMVCPGFSCGLGPPPRLRHTLFPAPQRPALGQMADGILVSCRHRRRWARSCWRPSPEVPNSTPPPPPPPPHPPSAKTLPMTPCGPTTTLAESTRRVHSPSPLTLTTHSPDCVCTLLRPRLVVCCLPPPLPRWPCIPPQDQQARLLGLPAVDPLR